MASKITLKFVDWLDNAHIYSKIPFLETKSHGLSLNKMAYTAKDPYTSSHNKTSG